MIRKLNSSWMGTAKKLRFLAAPPMRPLRLTMLTVRSCSLLNDSEIYQQSTQRESQRRSSFTRFPARVDRNSAGQSMEPRLVQAADLIGQLGDPMYSRKANALYCEFEEIGMNRKLG